MLEDPTHSFALQETCTDPVVFDPQRLLYMGKFPAFAFQRTSAGAKTTGL